MDLRPLALNALITAELPLKLQQVDALSLAAANGAALHIDPSQRLSATGPLPGRPPRPLLIDPAQVPRRPATTREGRAALIHAICHIEFNAINLALDAIWRFDGMPEAYYRDWLRVATEEVLHFRLLHELLQEQLGHSYGDFDAHNGLWSMCEKTADDVTARMALVPRTLEARGLDANPQIQRRLRAVGSPDARAACDILDIILRDEIGHVAIGNRWYGWLCAQQGLEPLAHYRLLSRRHRAPKLRGPFNLQARKQAGFSAAELAELAQADAS